MQEHLGELGVGGEPCASLRDGAGQVRFEGDTVHATTEILGKRESKSRPGAGIVEFHHRAYNQDGKLVAECRRQAFMRMRPK